jgi:hypothetical protein
MDHHPVGYTNHNIPSVPDSTLVHTELMRAGRFQEPYTVVLDLDNGYTPLTGHPYDLILIELYGFYHLP